MGKINNRIDWLRRAAIANSKTHAGSRENQARDGKQLPEQTDVDEPKPRPGIDKQRCGKAGLM